MKPIGPRERRDARRPAVRATNEDVFRDGKDPAALRTIGEVAQALGLRQHVLRYWEDQFPMLRPLTRAGGRRYYRPEDVALIRDIDRLLRREGYTIRGAQQALNVRAGGTRTRKDPAAPIPSVAEPAPVSPVETAVTGAISAQEIEPPTRLPITAALGALRSHILGIRVRLAAAMDDL